MAKWMVAAKAADFQKTAQKWNISPVMARLLRNRDITTEEEIRTFFFGTQEDMYSPYLLQDILPAAEMTTEKIRAEKKICVMGDYDVDGVCSTHILTYGLNACGAYTEAVIPERIADGYGMNLRMVQEAEARQIDTIITCDNGISAAEPIKAAKEKGMSVIVTDHHEIPFQITEDGRRKDILPEADYIIEPGRYNEETGELYYPFRGICGAVVAYKFIQVLTEVMGISGRKEILRNLLPFAALATVCDVMPLTEENRILVRDGLKEAEKAENTGLRALLEVTGLIGKPLTVYHAGFVLGPCLNASGRLDSAVRAVSLFAEQDMLQARKTAQELKELNESRKSMTIRGVEQANAVIASEHMEERRVLILYLAGVHESLAGIIAGRIREKYARPVYVLTDAEDGSLKGSGRSVEGYDMYEELCRCSHLFLRFGGHKMAAGITLEKDRLSDFIEETEKNCSLQEEDLCDTIHIDMELPPHFCTMEMTEEFERLQPCGNGNSRPLFVSRNIRILSRRILGKNKNVAKLRGTDQSGTVLDMVYFGDMEKLESILEKNGSEIMMVYYPDINEYNGRRTLQFVVRDLR